MTLALCLIAINHRDETIKYLDSWRTTADHWQDIELKLVDNGSAVPMHEWGDRDLTEKTVLRNTENKGVPCALNQLYQATQSDWILFVHNDVEMFERGWDTKLKRVLEGVGAGTKLGVAGFYGAKGLGTQELYFQPYQMHQLIRSECVSGCYRMPATHGYRPLNGEWEWVTMMDGFSLICNRQFLDENHGFDQNLPPHHMYDAHICLQALDLGYKNIVIAMDAFHHGGMTDVHEPWNDIFGKTKSEIHQAAHYPYFYDYWSPTGAANRKAMGKVGIRLPYRV